MHAPTEIDRDDWDHHWSEHATANALNPATVYRRELVLRALALRDAPRPVRVLDLGCGSGEFAMHLLRARPDIEVLGLDVSKTGIELARRKVPQGHFRDQDFTKPLTLEGFSGWATHAVCQEVLEHLDDPAGALRNVLPLLAPGCKLVITVPAGPMSAFDRHIGHRRHFTASRLRETIEDAGLRAEGVRGAGFPFFNVYRLVVIARGRRLIRDAAAGDESKLPAAAKVAFRVFGSLFKLNTDRTALGWQLVAVASRS